MNQEHIERLLERFHAGQATDADQAEIEQLLMKGDIDIEDVKDLSSIHNQVMNAQGPDPSPSLDKRFYDMLASAQNKNKGHRFTWINLFTLPDFASRMALGSLMLIIGLAAGYLLQQAPVYPRNEQIDALSKQVADLQEMMMLSLLEKGTATERLKAVSLTQEMDEASKKVTSALIQTLNQDENINVRLAALEALKPYSRDSSVREALILSIGKQESPLVQVSLAELMVALQEKGAVKEFEKIVQSENTPKEVKQKIRESIEVLI